MTSSDTPDSRERRRSERLPLEFETMYSISGKTGGRGKIVNISREGTRIYLDTHREIPPGTVIGMDIQASMHEGIIPARLTVAWVEELKDSEEFRVVVGGRLSIPDQKHEELLLRNIVQASLTVLNI